MNFLLVGKVELHGQKSKSGSIHIINATIGHSWHKNHPISTGNDLGLVVLTNAPGRKKVLRMNVMRPPSDSLLFGSRDYTDVSRALGELQARR